MRFLFGGIAVFDHLTDAELLAWLTYGEAEGEPIAGQLAVMHTVLNRIAKPRWWGNDVRSVILCPHQYDGLARIPRDSKNPPERFMTMALMVLGRFTVDTSLGSTHFHARYVKPNWGLPERVRIGGHIFYEEL